MAIYPFIHYVLGLGVKSCYNFQSSIGDKLKASHKCMWLEIVGEIGLCGWRRQTVIHPNTSSATFCCHSHMYSCQVTMGGGHIAYFIHTLVVFYVTYYQLRMSLHCSLIIREECPYPKHVTTHSVLPSFCMLLCLLYCLCQYP